MTEPHEPSLLTIAKPIAQRFLQTVVVLDDEAIYGEAPLLADTDTIIEPTFDDQNNEVLIEAPRLLHSLNAKRLTDSFARIGLVCSVLVPQDENSLKVEVRTSAKRADAVILDWTVHDIKGELAKELIQDITAADAADPNRLRLIAIYTAEPNLDEITDEIAISLEALKNGRVVTKGSTRVCVLGKKDIPEDQLPDAIIEQFALMIGGLLPLVAVSGISMLRDNTYRLLGRFHSQLDSAYLGHRLLSPNPAEAEQHLEAALGSEMQALIEDCRVGSTADIRAIKAWLNSEIEHLPNLEEIY